MTSAPFCLIPRSDRRRARWGVAGVAALTLLVAGLPFRMPQQYWRFSGIEDLLGVVGSSIISALLFSLLLLASGFPIPTETFPVIHALTLIVLLGTPRLVVLDEATAALDSTSEAAVQAALAEALAGRTSLVIAHRLSTVRQADLILVVEDGRIIERGGHTELLAAGGRYAELYRTQFAESQPVPAGVDPSID